MKLDWQAKELFLDGMKIHQFTEPVRGGLVIRDVAVVLLDGPKAKYSDPPELVEEMNRNVYGLNLDGTIKWRIASAGSPDIDNPNYCNSFAYISLWEDDAILYTNDGPTRMLNPETGETRLMPVPERKARADRVRASGRIISSPPSDP